MSSSLYQSVTLLEVGPSKQRFSAHTSLLVRESDFFKAALSGAFEEASGLVSLPEDTPETVAMFMTWLYTRLCQQEAVPGEIGARASTSSLLHLYIFADAKQVKKLQCDIVDHLLPRSQEKSIGPENISLVFNNLPSNSPIRLLVIDVSSLSVIERTRAIRYSF